MPAQRQDLPQDEDDDVGLQGVVENLNNLKVLDAEIAGRGRQARVWQGDQGARDPPRGAAGAARGQRGLERHVRPRHRPFQSKNEERRGIAVYYDRAASSTAGASRCSRPSSRTARFAPRIPSRPPRRPHHRGQNTTAIPNPRPGRRGPCGRRAARPSMGAARRRGGGTRCSSPRRRGRRLRAPRAAPRPARRSREHRARRAWRSRPPPRRAPRRPARADRRAAARAQERRELRLARRHDVAPVPDLRERSRGLGRGRRLEPSPSRRRAPSAPPRASLLRLRRRRRRAPPPRRSVPRRGGGAGEDAAHEVAVGAAAARRTSARRRRWRSRARRRRPRRGSSVDASVAARSAVGAARAGALATFAPTPPATRARRRAPTCRLRPPRPSQTPTAAARQTTTAGGRAGGGRASAAATSAATATLLRTRATFASSDPPRAPLEVRQRKGVASAPATPASRAASASRVAASTASVGSGAGWAPRGRARGKPQPRCAPNQAAALAAESTRAARGSARRRRRASGARRRPEAGCRRGDGRCAAVSRAPTSWAVEDGLDAAADDEHLRPPSSSRSALTSHLRGTQISPRPRRLDGSERHEGPLTSLTG